MTRRPTSGAVTLLALGAALVAGIGCSDRTTFGPTLACADSQSVTVQVEAGLTPKFTWQPGCGMSSIQVFTDSGTGVWVVYPGTDTTPNPLPSGIRYGQAMPDGYFVATPPAPLTAGRTYRVLVLRWIGAPGGPGSLFERGQADFTP